MKEERKGQEEKKKVKKEEKMDKKEETRMLEGVILDSNRSIIQCIKIYFC